MTGWLGQPMEAARQEFLEAGIPGDRCFTYWPPSSSSFLIGLRDEAGAWHDMAVGLLADEREARVYARALIDHVGTGELVPKTVVYVWPLVVEGTELLSTLHPMWSPSGKSTRHAPDWRQAAQRTSFAKLGHAAPGSSLGLFDVTRNGKIHVWLAVPRDIARLRGLEYVPFMESSPGRSREGLSLLSSLRERADKGRGEWAVRFLSYFAPPRFRMTDLREIQAAFNGGKMDGPTNFRRWARSQNVLRPGGVKIETNTQSAESWRVK